MAIAITPYSSAVRLLGEDKVAKWLGEYDAARLASYDVYDDMYDNSEETFVLLLRGQDEKPIYVPTAKRLINTLARYVGRGWTFKIDPTKGTAQDQKTAQEQMEILFKRERIQSKFSTGKKKYVRRGDWPWYLKADPDKDAGSRISVTTIDPRTYFPHTDDKEDLSRITGCSIIEEFLLPDGHTFALKEQRWDKPEFAPGLSEINAIDKSIIYEVNTWQLKDFQFPEKRVRLAQPIAPRRVPGITRLPIYNIKNGGDDEIPFGESDLKGIESLLAGINQAISDEDLALSVAGLGQFVTDAGAPVNDQNQRVPWQVGPKQVIEVALGRKFERMQGITSVTPVQDHVDYLEEQAYGVSGVNDIALGTRGIVSESGVALSIRMQPLFDASDERDLQVNDTFDNMFYDLQHEWFPIYEAIDFPTAVIRSSTTTGDRLPFDRVGRWGELVDGYTAGIFSLEFVHKELVDKFGYKMDKEDLQAALDDAQAKLDAADPYAVRAQQELTALPGDPNADPAAVQATIDS